MCKTMCIDRRNYIDFLSRNYMEKLKEKKEELTKKGRIISIGDL